MGIAALGDVAVTLPETAGVVVPWEVYGTVGGAKLPLAMLWAFVIGVAMLVGAVGRLPVRRRGHRARLGARIVGVTAGGGSRLRLGIVGTGWIATTHLGDLARIGRTELVGVVSRTPEAAAETAGTWGGRPYADVDAMLDEARPDVVWVCVPPHRSVAIGERLVERGIPFLVEKPLAAADADGPVRLASAIERAGLVVAVGYHWRGLDLLPAIRERLAERPPRLVIARWLGGTPRPYWWGRIDQGGGQVVEQATHLLDLARHLVGEAEVIGATSTYDPAASPPEVEVADATAATLRFETARSASSRPRAGSSRRSSSSRSRRTG